jgi:methanogenic corrinoid protein MtbC1
MRLDSFSKNPRTKEEIGETILTMALTEVMEQAMVKTKDDICVECLDRRCESGRDCREFIRRSNSYAWEIVATQAELN